MPTVDKLTKSDEDTIAALVAGKLSGLHMRVAETQSPKFKCIGVTAVHNPGLFTAKESPKSAIAIHQTVGLLASDLPTLTAQKNMSTNFLIARNGTILEIFPPRYYAYHLGKGCVGGNGGMSMRSISIEISTYGPLDLRTDAKGGNIFKTVYGSTYGTGDEKMDANGNVGTGGSFPSVVKLLKSYRGCKYYAALTEAQYTALRALLDYLQTFFHVPNAWLPYETRFTIFGNDAEAKDFKGVYTHVNVRPEGKWDIGPAVKWELITGEAKPVEFVAKNDEGAKAMEVIAEQKYSKEDDFEYKDTTDPITGMITETAFMKRQRIIRENNPLICAW